MGTVGRCYHPELGGHEMTEMLVDLYVRLFKLLGWLSLQYSQTCVKYNSTDWSYGEHFIEILYVLQF